MFRYLKEYNLKDMRQMIANEKRDPLICSEPMRGKLCVITGATSGVGLAAARRLRDFGADILMINRSREKSEKIAAELGGSAGSVQFIIADLSSLRETAGVLGELKKLGRPVDVLINNAGIHMTRREITAEGFEKVFALNHLSSFLLTKGILPLMTERGAGRIIQVNSQGHRFFGLNLKDLDWRRRPYMGIRAYGAAKTAQLLCMHEFNDMLRGSPVTINAMHPGAVKTAVGSNNGPLYRWYFRNFVWKSLRDVEISGKALHYLAASTDMEGISGNFYNLTTVEKPAPHALDRELGRRIWEESCRLVEPWES